MKSGFWSPCLRAHALVCLVLAGFLPANFAVADDTSIADLMVVFDASGSMWGQVDGVAKIEIARDVFTDLSADWQANGQSIGLIAYGHRRKGDCGDIEVLAQPSVAGSAALADVVTGLSPRGKTPLSQAVRVAAEELKFTENAATVVLLSDGKETCDLDPCAMGDELETLGVDFTAHVIGFDIREETDKAQLQCLADRTGGTYADARDAETLSRALADATGGSEVQEALGVTSVSVTLAVAEGTSRPASVRVTATNVDTSETRDLGMLDGADEVLSGATFDLPSGLWKFAAQGDGGAGDVQVALTDVTQEVSIPFTATDAAFELQSAGPFTLDGTITFQLRSLQQLQQNATYSVMLFPQGATEYGQNITYTYRFGSDPETTEHFFYPWEFDLPEGQYEIVIMGDSYDLSDHLGRFSIELVAALPDPVPAQADALTDAPARFALANVAEPLVAGQEGALQIDGPLVGGDKVMFIGLDGQDTQLGMLTDNGVVAIPSQISLGAYRVELLRQDGSTQHLDVVDILPASANEIADHSMAGENPETMVSAEELAAENGPKKPPFTVWKSCELAEPCRVTDRRVGLEWTLPSGWASEEPFYYTTAGGAQADHPTMHMARISGGAFEVILNPRQWDAQLGPCEVVVHGVLCQQITEVLQDQADYALIRDTLNGEFPKPQGWLPIGRSWTLKDNVLDVPVGVMKFEEPEERAETIRAYLKLSSPAQFGLNDSSIVEGELGLIWDDAPLITAINGEIALDDGKLFVILARPGGWDGTANSWIGQVMNQDNFRTILVTLY